MYFMSLTVTFASLNKGFLWSCLNSKKKRQAIYLWSKVLWMRCKLTLPKTHNLQTLKLGSQHRNPPPPDTKILISEKTGIRNCKCRRNLLNTSECLSSYKTLDCSIYLTTEIFEPVWQYLGHLSYKTTLNSMSVWCCY